MKSYRSSSFGLLKPDNGGGGYFQHWPLGMNWSSHHVLGETFLSAIRFSVGFIEAGQRGVSSLIFSSLNLANGFRQQKITETNIGLFLKLRQFPANQKRRKLFMSQFSETGEEWKRFFLWEKRSLGEQPPGAEARLLQSPFKGWDPDSCTNSHWTQPWVHRTWLGKPTQADGPSVHHPPLQLHGSEKVVHPNAQSTWTKLIPEAVLPLSSFFLTQLVLTLNRRAGKEGDKA